MLFWRFDVSGVSSARVALVHCAQYIWALDFYCVSVDRGEYVILVRIESLNWRCRPTLRCGSWFGHPRTAAHVELTLLLLLLKPKLGDRFTPPQDILDVVAV